MANLIKKYDILNSNFLRDFFEDDFMGDTFFHRRLSPPVNISEDADRYMLEVLTPGIEKENIKIKRQGNILTISYEQQDTAEYEGKNYHRREFQKKSFSRSLNLPENVKIEDISSEYRDGILKISMPKLEKGKPEDDIIDIEVK